MRSAQGPINNKGTARWMSPEQMSQGITNKPTDIYSFAMTMYEVCPVGLVYSSPAPLGLIRRRRTSQIFTESPPFSQTDDGMLLQIVYQFGLRPSRPDEEVVLPRGLTDTVWNLIERCWKKTAKDRPTAASISEELEQLLEVTTVRTA